MFVIVLNLYIIFSVFQLEKIHLVRDTEDRLDLQAQRYEERLTELHSVIAELSRKIERHKSLVIQEEEEEEAEAEAEGDEGATHSPDTQSQLSHDVSGKQQREGRILYCIFSLISL